MQKIIWLFTSVLLLSVVFTTTSCNEDDLDPTPQDTPPFVSLTAQPPIDTTLAAQITVSISVEKGDNPIKTITVQEDGVNLDLSRVSVNGIGANPLLVAGDDVNGLSWDLLVTVSDQCGSYNYTIIATDDAGLTNETSFFVSLESEIAPTLTYNSTPSVGVGSINQVIDLNIKGEVGDRPLSTITILEGGFSVDASRVEYNSLFENPIFLTGADVDAFDGIIKFAAQDMEDTRTFTIELADDCGVVSTLDFELTVNTGTPLNGDLTGVLLNQAGPAGTGALDLDSGLSCGVTTNHPTNGITTDDIEIRDMGIDQSLPNDQNWRTQMGPITANGVTMKRVDLTQVENFTFENVTTVEQIQGAHDTGLGLLEDVGGNIASTVVQAGDLFTVERNGKVYLIRVDVVSPTTADNNDQYELSIKH